MEALVWEITSTEPDRDRSQWTRVSRSRDKHIRPLCSNELQRRTGAYPGRFHAPFSSLSPQCEQLELRLSALISHNTFTPKPFSFLCYLCGLFAFAWMPVDRKLHLGSNLLLAMPTVVMSGVWMSTMLLCEWEFLKLEAGNI